MNKKQIFGKIMKMFLSFFIAISLMFSSSSVIFAEDQIEDENQIDEVEQLESSEQTEDIEDVDIESLENVEEVINDTQEEILPTEEDSIDGEHEEVLPIEEESIDDVHEEDISEEEIFEDPIEEEIIEKVIEEVTSETEPQEEAVDGFKVEEPNVEEATEVDPIEELEIIEETELEVVSQESYLLDSSILPITREQYDKYTEEQINSLIDDWYSKAEKRLKLKDKNVSNITKINSIAKCVAEEFDYSGYYSGASSMILFGGGDCWASSSLVCELCRRAGIESWLRTANNDSGAGSGHRNSVAKIDGKFYIIEAGYSGKKPRGYDVEEAINGFSFMLPYYNGSTIATVYQYDGDATAITVPKTYNGYTVTTIGTNIQKTEYRSVFSDSLTRNPLKSIHIPKTVEEIIPSAFIGARRLTSITVDSANPKYKSIDGSLYSKDGKELIKYKVTNNKNVYIPSTVTKLGDFAFASNSGIETVCLAAMKAPTYTGEHASMLTYDSNGITFVVPEGAKGYDVFPWTELKVKYAKKVNSVNIDINPASIKIYNSTNVNCVVSPSNAYVNATYTTSNSKVASLRDGYDYDTQSNYKTVYGESPGTATITGKFTSIRFTTNGIEEYSVGTKTKKVTILQPVRYMYINDYGTVSVGKTRKFGTYIYPENASNKKSTWKSSNPKIATVDNNGNVKGIKKGTVTITATTVDGGYTSSVEVSVVAGVESIKLSNTSLTLLPDQWAYLTATISPSNADNQTLEYISSNPDVVTAYNGGVWTNKVGTAIITVRARDGSGVEAKCTVKVVKTLPVSPTKVSLNKTSASILKGKTLQLTATVAPSNATDKTVTWKSSNTKVATVSTTGKVTAKAAGTATITCTTKTGSKKATAKITVTLTKEEGINEFVERCYTKVLGRKSEKNGKKYWVDRIMKATNTKEEALKTASDGFFNSTEFLNKKTNQTEFVKICYRTFLDREAEAGGLNYWLNKLKSGMTRNEVLKGFAYSTEFSNIMASYGIK